jgi:hypothetical protein
MPQIHDPRKALGPGRFVAKRSRRRRRKDAASPLPATTTTTTTTETTTTLIGKDLLDFCNEIDEVVPNKKSEKDETMANDSNVVVVVPSSSSSSTNTKKKAPPPPPPSSAKAVTPFQQQTVPSVASPNGGTQPVTLAPNDPYLRTTTPTPFRHALAMDTRYLDLETTTAEEEEEGQQQAANKVEIQRERRTFLQAIVRRGLTPCVVTWSELQHPVSTKKTARPKQPVLGVRSTNHSSMTQGFLQTIPSVPVRPTTKDNNDCGVQVPKGLLAYASWKLFSDLGKTEQTFY